MITSAQFALRILAALFAFGIATHGAAAPGRADKAADAQPLAGLVTEFFSSANQSVFVSFTRHWIHPSQTITETNLTQKDGTILQFIPFDHDYYAFIRKDQYYLIAHSVSNSILSTSDFLKADSLQGFDGEHYWFLSLNKPHGWKDETNGGTDEIQKERTFSFNRLELIPAKEGQRNPGDPKMDVQLASQLGLVREFSSVAQLGYPELLEPHVLRSGDSLTLQLRVGGQISAVIKGKQNHPSRIEYSMNDRRISLASDLDYSKNTITINRTLDGHKVFEAEYRVFSMSLPDKNTDSNLFSWRRYIDAAGNVMSTMSEDNSTYEVKILPNGTIKPGTASIHQNTHLPPYRNWVLGAFVILSFSAPVLFKWMTGINKKQ